MTGPIATAGEAHAALRALPVLSLDAILRGDRPLVLAPHPDDESLGCGGLLALCAAAGIPGSVAMLTDGAASHPGSPSWPPHRLAAERERECRAALSELGHPLDRLRFHRFPDAALPNAGPEFERAVSAVLEQADADDCRLLLAPWIADPHCDHEAAQRIARAAASRSNRRLLSYPVWGWTLPPDAPLPEPGRLRGCRLPVDPVRPTKRRAVAAHRTQAGTVIADAPDAFVLPSVLLDACDQPFETFIETVP
ncbi:MAG: PIG-L family deacetylase [Gluconacetobacter diazotrophicus]|nr:PIG-L family deacetylase [Gluconacetobacter diazotrophicus]